MNCNGDGDGDGVCDDDDNGWALYIEQTTTITGKIFAILLFKNESSSLTDPCSATLKQIHSFPALIK